MKRFISIFLIALTLFTLCIPVVASASETKYVRLTNGYVYVRKGPGTNYTVVDKLYNRDEVTVYETQNGFSRIGTNRWVSSQYLKDLMDYQERYGTANISYNPNRVTEGIKKLQHDLEGLAYWCGENGQDGCCGNDTVEAIKAFQREHNLTADGVAGNKTKAAIYDEAKAGGVF